MPSEPQDTLGDDDYFGLMDIVVVIAEWWLYLLAAAVIVGGIAFGAASMRGPNYNAVAVVDVTEVAEELLLSPAVMDRIVAKTGLASSQQFRSLFKMNTVDAKSAELEITGGSADSAMALMSAVIAELEALSLPTPAQKEIIERNIERLRQSIARDERAREQFIQADQLETDPANLDRRAVAIVSASANIDENLEKLEIEEQKLAGFGQGKIISGPTVIEVPVGGRLKTTIFAIVGALGVVMAIGVARELWLRAGRDPINRPKADRIRRAFFKSRPA